LLEVVDYIPLGSIGRKLCGGIQIADFSVLASENITNYTMHN